MSIGKWIVFSFVMFTLFIGTLVAICVRQDMALVSKDYYKEELAYQAQIQRISNTRSLERLPELKITDGNVHVNFPEDFNPESGYVKVFRPSDAKKDKQFVLTTGLTTQSFKIDHLSPGLYRVKMWWIMNNNEYFFEKEIVI